MGQLPQVSVRGGAHLATKAMITPCDLSSLFFCIDTTFLCEFESDRILIMSLSRIVADKSDRVIVA